MFSLGRLGPTELHHPGHLILWSPLAADTVAQAPPAPALAGPRPMLLRALSGMEHLLPGDAASVFKAGA